MDRGLQRVRQGAPTTGAGTEDGENAAAACEVHGSENQNAAGSGGGGELQGFFVAASESPGQNYGGDTEYGGEFGGEGEGEENAAKS